MSSKYSEIATGMTTLAVVIEDNIWEYGKKKKKAKINIPILMPLQEQVPTVTVVERYSKRIKKKKVEKTVNYLEIFLPDSLYTYPENSWVKNPNQKLYGAKASHYLDNGTNGAKRKGLTRIVHALTKIVIVIIDNDAKPQNIKVISKFDDYLADEEEKEHGVTKSARTAATR